MIKREAKFTLLFRHWLRANPEAVPANAVFELKQTSGSLPFDAVQEHQIDALLAANSSTGLLYKAPDDSRGIKPFDLFKVRNVAAYVVIKFPKHFELIPIDTFMLEKGRSKRKSLTASRAREISSISVKTTS